MLLIYPDILYLEALQDNRLYRMPSRGPQPALTHPLLIVTRTVCSSIISSSCSHVPLQTCVIRVRITSVGSRTVRMDEGRELHLLWSLPLTR